MSRRILFVDDDENVLKGIRRLMFGVEGSWEAEFAGDSTEALEKLSQGDFHVVVSDMKMPGMDGAEFLRRVSEESPHVVRIILSGQSDKDMIMKSVRQAHQFLSKPCSSETLQETLRHATSLCDMLANKKLVEVVTKLSSLPSLPSLYQEVMAELQSPEFSMSKVAEIISKDVGMTAKILQLVNSSFFGLAVRVTDAAHAVKLLGAEIIKGLVLSVHIFSQYDRMQSKHLSIDKFTTHCLAVGTLAKQVAITCEQSKDVVEESMLAGMLHDIGKLILAQNIPEEYDMAMHIADMNNLPAWQGEREIIGSTHAEVGAYLVGLWGLSQNIIDALALHHEPMGAAAKGFGPLTAVYVANTLTNQEDLDDEYIQALTLEDKVGAWRESAANHPSDEALV